MSDNGSGSEANSFLANHPEVEAVDLLISDLNAVARGKRIEKINLNKVYTEGVNLPCSVFSMNILGDTVEECGLGLEMGEPDLVCRPVENTLHLAPWQKRPCAQLLMSMFNKDGTPFHADPRHILNNIVDKLKIMKLTPVVAVELEFYLFDKKRDENGRIQAPISPKTGLRDKHTQVYSLDTLSEYSDFLEEISATCALQNVPADTAVAECAPGQFEINLKHQADPLLACDNAILLKRIIKAVADKHGFDASFMAKPYGDEAGSGMHIHVSMYDENDNNVFADEHKAYSEQLEYAIGGMLSLMPSSMALLCPNVNSYRRFQPEFYVATKQNWGLDNRSVALRIPFSNKKATRIEHRISGADANPYLVMAVILASIHHGLTNKIAPLSQPSTGNAFDDDTNELPTSFAFALLEFAKSGPLHDYLGQAFCDIYQTAKQSELDQFESHITELETQWYLTNV